MTLRHMKIFRAVCQSGYSLTRAAESLHMTQPAVSLAVSELEKYYGVRLFDRLGRRLEITEAGKSFLQYAVHITDLFDDMETTLRDWDQRGILRVGASITIGSQFLPEYVRAFKDLKPDIDVRAEVAPTDQLEKRLLTNELDCALIEGVAHDPSIVSEPYMEDHLSVVCPVDGGWSQGQTITKEEFISRPFLLREHGSGTREVFDRVMEAAGLSVVPAWEAMSTTALVNAVINGLGIAVLPHRMILPALLSGQVVAVRVQGLSFKRSFSIIYHKDKFLTGAARAFIDLCRRYESDYPQPRVNGLFTAASRNPPA